MIINQNRSKIFLAIIAILLIINIVLIGFFLQKKAQDKQGERPDRKAFTANFLQKEIGFNPVQLSKYDTLSNLHRQKISGLFENIRNNKTRQFKELVTLDFTDSAINMVAGQSAAAQKIIDMTMFNHIKSIRMLCTREQLPKFDSLFVKVLNRKGEGRKKSEK
jgi:periplasmic protein CpxP/Spy